MSTGATPAATPGSRPNRDGGVWGLTLWANRRRPIFVGAARGAVALSPIGEALASVGRMLPLRFPELTTDSFAILPDRVRLLLHVPPGRKACLIARSMGWLKAGVGREARRRSLLGDQPLWEMGFEAYRVQGADELAFWRRRTEAGLSAVTSSNASWLRSIGRWCRHGVPERDLDLHAILGDGHLGEDLSRLREELGSFS